MENKIKLDMLRSLKNCVTELAKVAELAENTDPAESISLNKYVDMQELKNIVGIN